MSSTPTGAPSTRGSARNSTHDPPQSNTLNVTEGGLRWSRQFRSWLVAWIVFVIFSLLRKSWRMVPDESAQKLIEAARETGVPHIVAHFHEDEWPLLSMYANHEMNILVSLSGDGGIMASFAEKIGYRVTRGSSSRGAVSGLLGLLRNVKRSKSRLVSMAVDGPRGPRRRTKNGVFKLAQSLKAPIFAVSAAADRYWRFEKSWSKAFVPKPFAKVRVRALEFLPTETVKKLVERDDFADLSYQLEEKLKAAKSLAIKDLNP